MVSHLLDAVYGSTFSTYTVVAVLVAIIFVRELQHHATLRARGAGLGALSTLGRVNESMSRHVNELLGIVVEQQHTGTSASASADEKPPSATTVAPGGDAADAQPLAPFKIAAASIRSARGQTAQNIATHVKFAEQAAKQGANLVMFPEGSIHSLWCTFDAGATTTELAANSEPIPGPTTTLMQQHCKRLNIAMAFGMNHLGMARMPNGKALNAYVVVDGSGVVHVQHKAHPTWCEDKFYRGGGDYWKVFTLASAPGRKFAIGICADRSYIAQNLYNDVAKQGCNVFLAPSAGAGNTVDWISMHASINYVKSAGLPIAPGLINGRGAQAAAALCKGVSLPSLTDPHYPAFRPGGSPPKAWGELLGNWKFGDPDSKKSWAYKGGLTAKGGTLAGGAFIYCNAKDVRVTVDEPGHDGLDFYMSGTSAIHSKGVCIAADNPLDAQGNSIETLIVGNI